MTDTVIDDLQHTEVSFILIKPRPGASISMCKQEAIALCANTQKNVIFTFNDTMYHISYDHIFNCVKQSMS